MSVFGNDDEDDLLCEMERFLENDHTIAELIEVVKYVVLEREEGFV